MELVPAGNSAAVDRYIGYYEPYATSHEALDKDVAVQQEVRMLAETLANTVHLQKDGKYEMPRSRTAESSPR